VVEALHIHVGDEAVLLHQKSGVGGVAVAWKDSPAVGPATLDEVAYARVRAEHWRIPQEAFTEGPTRQDLDAAGELTLWFGPGVWDQWALVRCLVWLERMRPASPVAMVDAVTVQGLSPFSGFAQLPPETLRTLMATRRILPPEALTLASATWVAFGQGNAPAMLRAARHASGHFAHLLSAATRVMEELPWTSHGLSRTQHQLLAAVGEGSQPFAVVLGCVAARESPWHGMWQSDTIIQREVTALASGGQPLLRVEGRLPGARVGITPAGSEVLRGTRDGLETGVAGRVVGGVALGPPPGWWWHAGKARPVLHRQ